jgi:hypothetical protein
MTQIKIDVSVSRENLVEMIEMGGIAQIEAHLDHEPSETTAELYEFGGYVFCQVSTDPGVGCWCWWPGRQGWRRPGWGWRQAGEEDLEEVRVEALKALVKVQDR